jgi:uncharacterized protein (TIGR03435 family)
MRTVEVTLTTVLLCAAAGIVTAQRATPASPKLTFDAVSIRRNMTNDIGANIIDRANGFTMLNVPVSALVARAYSPTIPLDMVGLPRWATSDRYDITATSSLANPSAGQRTEMLRSLLADRFKLTAHTERRPEPAYDLVLARADGRLGPGIKPSTVDCEKNLAASAAKPAGAPDVRAAAGAVAARATCTMAGDGDTVEGDTTIPALADMLVPVAGRSVVDKTGLKGTYHVTLTYAGGSSIPRPVTPSSPLPPLIFDAVQEQLGMKLQSSTTTRETLVIDHLEKPSEN